MAKEYSTPFTPDVPVTPEFFVGRSKEIQALIDRARLARQGRIETTFLTGARGIGKSSLARFVRHYVTTQERMLGVHVFLAGTTHLEEMARRLFDRLLNDTVTQPWHQRLLDFFGDHVRKVGLFGVTLELVARERDLGSLVLGLPRTLAQLADRLKPDVEGMLLILDDINGLAESAEFANWLKTTVDEMATRDSVLPLCLTLVGVPERRAALVHSQPSLARLFTPVELSTWSREETREFLARALAKVDTRAEPDALGMLATFAGGLPVLAHELGQATLNLDRDGIITMEDALSGVTAAAEIVGRKHLEPTVYAAIRSERYRAILRTVGVTWPEPIRRKDVASRLSETERKVLDNFLTRMKALEVLLPDPEAGRGAYRFANPLYAAYVNMEGRLSGTREGH